MLVNEPDTDRQTGSLSQNHAIGWHVEWNVRPPKQRKVLKTPQSHIIYALPGTQPKNDLLSVHCNRVMHLKPSALVNRLGISIAFSQLWHNWWWAPPKSNWGQLWHPHAESLISTSPF